MNTHPPDNLPTQNKPQRELFGAISIAEISSGPLPSPKILREYDELVPGTAARIIAMAEKQSTHRQEMESQIVRSRIRNSRLGLIFGLLIGLASLTAATISAINGSNLVGSVIGVSGLASLAGVFVYGSQQQRQERRDRLKQLTQNGSSQ